MDGGIGRSVRMPYYSTGRMQAAVLRTWGDPWLVGRDQTYLGPDNRLTAARVGISLSGYVRVPEDRNERRRPRARHLTHIRTFALRR